MKKRKMFVFILCFILALSILILLEFTSMKLRNRPLIYIKHVDEEKRMVIYNSFLYRVIECTAEEDNFTIVNYSKKISDNYCPRTIKMDYDDGDFINSKGVRISKEDYDILYRYYSISEINSMDYESVRENVLKLKNSMSIENN